jgi:hypothetical protein
MFALIAVAFAAPPTLSIGGDVKSFFVAGFPRPWFGLSDSSVALLEAAGLTEVDALELYGLDAEPDAQGVLSARLKATGTWGPVRLDVHWAGAAQTVGQDAVVGLGTGAGLSAPELLPLTWAPDTGDLILRHRIDRLVLSAKLPHVDLTVGRQPVSFGSGRFFAPMDLVNPFHPATIDTEYKPGVDALRVDAYAGVATKFTAVAAWAGQPLVGDDAREEGPILDDLVLAATGQATVGITDLSVFVGDVHAEPVFGLGVVSGIGPVGVHADATLTVPEDEDVFVRAVAGADGRPTETTTITGEFYIQSFGATDPADYLDAVDSPRFTRGELWQMGQLYGAVAVVQEITPLIHVNASAITNLRDPSALLTLGGAWSVADNADVVFGGYLGVGEGTDIVELDLDPLTGGVVPPTDAALADSVNSEFGLYPGMVYVQVRAYF